MKTSELVTREQDIHRKVGVVVPADRRATGLAIDLYRNLGIDVIVQEQTLFVYVGKALAASVQGVLERRTGIIAFNEWEPSTLGK